MCHSLVQFSFQFSNHFLLIDREIAEQNSKKNNEIKQSRYEAEYEQLLA